MGCTNKHKQFTGSVPKLRKVVGVRVSRCQPALACDLPDIKCVLGMLILETAFDALMLLGGNGDSQDRADAQRL